MATVQLPAHFNGDERFLLLASLAVDIFLDAVLGARLVSVLSNESDRPHQKALEVADSGHADASAEDDQLQLATDSISLGRFRRHHLNSESIHHKAG